MYIQFAVKVEWNRTKAVRNRLKHRVDFPDAALVMTDERAITVEDKAANGEARYVSVGMDGHGRVLVVVYAYRGGAIRLISARRASKAERKAYEEGI